MSRKMWGIVLLACVGTAAAALGGKQQYDQWARARPTEANLAAAIREHLARDSLTHEPRESLRCIRVPSDYPQPDSRSKLRKFGWHIDLLKAPSGKPERDKQLGQLDALAAVGLLRKEDSTIARPGEQDQPAWRYRLSQTGWAVTHGDCLVYGNATYLGMAEAPKEIEYKGQKVRQVIARVGVVPAAGLQDWAADARIQAAFPEVSKALQGEQRPFALHLREGRWQPFSEQPDVDTNTDSLPKEERERLKELALKPDASRAELEKLASGFFIPCLAEPGSEKLPADKLLHRSGSAPYKFGIYLDKPRTAYDKVANKTLPLVQKLLAVGAIVQLPSEKAEGTGLDAGKTFEMAVYDFAPHLRNTATGRQGQCFSLGPPSFEFVDIQYRKTDRFGRPVPTFTYKLIVRYKQPPVELTDPVLQSAWPDLRGLLEHGTACSGEFQFNKVSRTAEAGAGSCWDAFDSYYENY